MANDQETTVIGIDWGTTALRACRLSRQGPTEPVLEKPWGILAAGGEGYPVVLERVLTAMGADQERCAVLLSGMIGSRQGWVEAPYLTCPAALEDLSAALVPVQAGEGRDVRVVPGLDIHPQGGAPDVMRGEETQILGVLEEAGVAEGLFVMPGTHSKWVRVEGARVENFATFMTGEVFAVLTQHSILGRGMQGSEDETAASPPGEAFDAGVSEGLDTSIQHGGMLHRLFGVRTRGLFGALNGPGQRDYLSGLLIGTELAEARAMMGGTGRPVTVVAGGALSARYGRALSAAGMEWVAAVKGAAFHGHVRLARGAGLLGENGRP